MTLDNMLTISPIFGGGNSESSELAKAAYAPAQGRGAVIKGRLSSFLLAMIVVPFVFLAPCALTSCSSDSEQEETSQQDYQALLTAHDWEISQADECVGGFWLDAKDVDAYCRFTSDSVYCSEGETVTHFDEDGKVTGSKYEITFYDMYPYVVKGDEIMIENQTFKITSAGPDAFVLENEGWRLVLKKKQS